MRTRSGAAGEASTRLLGKQGEAAAARFLKGRGYRILARNYTCPAGEIDIIALDGAGVVFVEVKTRRSDAAGDPEVSVHAHKRRQMTQAAKYFLTATKTQDRACRFDVLAIVMPDSGPLEIEHFIDAFQPRGRS